MSNRNTIRVYERLLSKNKKEYTSELRLDIKLEDILCYLKSNNIPRLDDYPKVAHHDIKIINEKSFKRVIKSGIPPIPVALSYLVPFDEISVEHDIAYNENMIVIVAKNPACLQGKFNFTDKIIIERDGEGVIFNRTAVLANIAETYSIIGSSFSHFNSYFINQVHDFYFGMYDEIKSSQLEGGV